MSRATPGHLSARTVIHTIVAFLEASGYACGTPARLKNAQFDDRYVYTVWVYPPETSLMANGAQLTLDPKSMELVVQADKPSFRREIEDAIRSL